MNLSRYYVILQGTYLSTYNLVPTAWKDGKKRLYVGGSLAMKPLLSGIKKYCLPSTRRVLLCLHSEFRYYALTQFASYINYVGS